MHSLPDSVDAGVQPRQLPKMQQALGADGFESPIQNSSYLLDIKCCNKVPDGVVSIIIFIKMRREKRSFRHLAFTSLLFFVSFFSKGFFIPTPERGGHSGIYSAKPIG
jgi:hypothetical protein